MYRSAKVIIVPHLIIWSWYTSCWWVGSYIWYCEEGTGHEEPSYCMLFTCPAEAIFCQPWQCGLHPSRLKGAHAASYSAGPAALAVTAKVGQKSGSFPDY